MTNKEKSYDFKKVPSILLVDDEASVLSSLKRLFRKLKYNIVLANSGQEAVNIIEQQSFDLIISDARMPEMSGPEFLAIAAEKFPDTMRILLTGFADIEATIDAVNLGKIDHYIEKPWDDKELVALVEKCISTVDMKEHNAYLQSLIAKQNEQLKAVNESLERRVKERTNELNKSHNELCEGYQQAISLFSNLMDQRSTFTAETPFDITDLITTIANELNLSDDLKTSLKHAASLRYVGQLSMPDSLLNIPYESMSKDQKKLYEEYPIRGSLLLSTMPPLREAADIIAQHKEYINSKGFPKKDFGKHISLPAQILNISNDFLELTSGKLKAEKLSMAEAMNLINSRSNDYYDSKLVELLNKSIEPKLDTDDEKENRLWTNQLITGMELAKNLYGHNDSLLLSKGSILTDQIIEKLFDLEKRMDEQLVFHIKNQPLN